jgi:4-hydroxy-tetrahydrodipicolinate reductase
MIRAAVTGAAGRMGGQIVRLICETDGIGLASAVERPGHPCLGRDAGELAGVGSLGVPVTNSLAETLPAVDVVIDFTSAPASLSHLEAVCRAGSAIVIGSTGFEAGERERIRQPQGGARVFQAPNMSVGVNVLLRVVADVARRLGDAYDVEIVETHHRFKKDAPSGTALALAEAAASALGRDLEAVCRAGSAIVIGSTGFGAQERERIRQPQGGARVFQAPNMSVGVNVLLRVVADVARRLGDTYDVEIVETHHRFKKDAPSGTALALAEAAASALGRDLETDAVHGRQGLVGERKTREIGIHAVRAGDVVGDHTVIFGGLGERVEITHKASSRETFARGAIRAACWLPSQPPGFYGMADLLGF